MAMADHHGLDLRMDPRMGDPGLDLLTKSQVLYLAIHPTRAVMVLLQLL
jgi:hypothetical protein